MTGRARNRTVKLQIIVAIALLAFAGQAASAQSAKKLQQERALQRQELRSYYRRQQAPTSASGYYQIGPAQRSAPPSGRGTTSVPNR